ncbi:MAG: hypothetical protein PHC61_02085, partial [Chitinivibrionales bacterium]|nr:hypothetical protein [Chitinivibrionales bacterium]
MSKIKTLSLLVVVQCALLAGIVAFMCSPVVPKSSGSGDYAISFNLEQMGRYSAVYWGMPIPAIIIFPDTVTFADIGWHLPSGSYRAAYGPSARVKQITVDLYWDKIPLHKDSLGNPVDTLFITLGGGLFSSNSVYVTVRNLPPLIDSIKINKSKLTGSDSVYFFNTDSAGPWSVHLYAHDVKGDSVRITWTARRNDSLGAFAGPITSYRTPAGNFT